MDTEDINGREPAGSAAEESSTLRLRDADRTAGQGDDAEARMRQALGLFGTRPSAAGFSGAGSHPSHDNQSRMTAHRPTAGGASARRHRFVQDGEVSVSVVRSQPAGRSLTAEAERLADDLSRERHRASELERQLHEVHNQLRGLQTRAGLAELERDKALAELQVMQTRLQEEAAHTTRAAAVPDGREEVRQTTLPVRRGRRHGEQAQLALDEPEPVQWWLHDYGRSRGK